MKNLVVRRLIVGVLCIQLLGGATFVSADTVETSVTVAMPHASVSSLMSVIQLLKQALSLIQQKNTLTETAAIPMSLRETAATVTASNTLSSKGWIESVSPDGVITGWALNLAASNTPTLVDILVDGQIVGTTSTFVYRSDVNAAQKVSGKHGFTFALSTVTKSDGKPHHVDVKVTVTGQVLNSAKVVPVSQVFTIPPTLTWSNPVWGIGIPDVEVYRGGRNYEIFGNRQYAAGGMKKVVAIHSLDGGSTWSDLGTIATATLATDLGDGSMTSSSTSNGGTTTLYFAYRYNQATTTTGVRSYFSIRLKKSTDFGQTWQDFGTPSGIVHEHTTSTADRNGLWTPQVLINSDGDLLVNYDDQLFPDVVLRRPNGGQFGSMMTKWNPQTNSWGTPIIIGQGTDGRADGVGARTQINLGSGRIWSPVESSVGTTIHSLALRFTESYDNGRTWSLTPAALAAKQIIASDWNRGIKDESVLYELPPRGVNASGTPAWYDWSWPLAIKLKLNPDANKRGLASAIFVLFRSDEERPYTVSEGEMNTSHGIEKKLFYLLSTNGAKSWVKGKATDVPILDHRPVALHDGSVLIGYSLRDAADSAHLYQIKKGCFTATCSL
jgi:hypothetical protein